MYRESYFLAGPSIPNIWITMIATIRPTNPCEPKLLTMLEMLPITSPIRIFEPNRMFAKIPNPIRPTNIDDNPPTNDLTISIILFIKTSYEFNIELYIIAKMLDTVKYFMSFDMSS